WFSLPCPHPRPRASIGASEGWNFKDTFVLKRYGPPCWRTVQKGGGAAQGLLRVATRESQVGPAERDEPGLIQQLKAGDHEAFGVVLHRHGKRVCREAFGLVCAARKTIQARRSLPMKAFPLRWSRSCESSSTSG